MTTRTWMRVLLVLVMVAPTLVTSPAGAGPGDPDCPSLFPGLERFTPEGRCRLVAETPVGGSATRVYVHEDVPSGRAPDGDVATRTNAALDHVISTYTALGAMPAQIDVLLVPSLARADGDGYTSSDDRGVCVITTGLAQYRRQALYQHTLAHELFHCFQLALVGDEAFTAGGNASEWWYEGTAEYFANVAFPADDVEREFLPDLRRFEPGAALVDLATEAYVFFQHFANRLGNAAVVDFMRTLPTRGGRTAQVAAAAAWPGMDELFDDYARALLADAIVDTNGETIPTRVRATTRGTASARRAGEVFAIDDLEPFEIDRIKVVFEEGHEFDLDELRDAGVRAGVQQGDARAPWEDELPDPLETCNTDQRWRVVLTTITDDARAARLDVAGISEADESSLSCCAVDATSDREPRVTRREVRITVCGAIEAVFTGGVCYVEDGFLQVTAGYGVYEAEIEATGPYPRGYAFILGTDQPGTEPPGFPNVTIADDAGDFTELGSSASLTKSSDLLRGTFVADDIAGTYRCPRLTPVEELE